MEDGVLLSDLSGRERCWLKFSNGFSHLTLILGAKNKNGDKESARK